jgi:putative colanic acid biosynthesis acetyltransferase WcaF
MIDTLQNKTALKRTTLSLDNKLGRIAWSFAYHILFRPSPTFLHGWRAFLLRRFGARIGHGAHAYPRARIWAPWNLVMGRRSCLANDVDCYSVAQVTLGDDAVVSQYTYLCSASHDFQDAEFPLVSAPIIIENRAWVAAGAFIGPGVTIGEGAVVGARSTVLRDATPWTVYAGNPARPIKARRR